MLAAAVLWGTTGTSQALAPDSATPGTVGAVRLVLGGAVILAFALARGALPPLARWRAPALAAAAVALALYQVLFFSGVSRAGVALGTVVGIGSAPVIAGAIAAVTRRERPGGAWAVATALAIAGVALLVLGSGAAGDAPVDAAGVALAVGAGAAYAAYVEATKRLLDAGWTPVGVVGAAFPLGAVLIAPALLAGDASWTLEPRGALVAAHLGLVTVGVAYAAFARGLARVTAPAAVTLTLAEPVTAALLGVLLLGEPVTWTAGAGAALVAGGLAVITLTPARRG